MPDTHPTCKILLKLVIILNLLSRNVETFRPNNYTLIKKINSLGSSWLAGKNPTNIPWRISKSQPEKPSALPVVIPPDKQIPRVFDVRLRWYRCSSIIEQIRHQGECSSSWAVATASVISDRICIGSNGTKKLHISGEDLLTCCPKCLGQIHVCHGGYASEGLHHWASRGIVTGGEISSKKGCKPYSTATFAGRHTYCVRKCTNKSYKKTYQDDGNFGNLAYRVMSSEKNIQQEVFRNGPVVTSIKAFEDFAQYKSGVYQHLLGDLRHYHHVKITGWGVEKGVKYWQIVNSWGPRWGQNGMARFLRGVNHCGIETSVFAGRTDTKLLPHERVLYVEDSGGSTKQFSFGKCVFVEMILFYMYVR